MAYSFGNTIGSIPGIVSPLVTTIFTGSSSLGWHAVFILAAGINTSAGAIWMAAGSVRPVPDL